MKRFLTLLLALLLSLSICGPAYATGGVERDTWINPLYADVISPDEIPEPVLSDTPAAAAVGTATAAKSMLREQMKQRTKTFTFETGFYLDGEGFRTLFYDAMAHTGDPVEGDYLLWQVGGYKVAIYNNSRVTCTMTWYTTAAQERLLDSRLASVMLSLHLENLTDYGKIASIYGYITEHVRYDYAHLYDEEYTLQYTAYAALVNGTAVCQGYAVLFYRMALEAGVDNRVITGYAGESHAWNIAKLSSRYYNLDATWDEGRGAGSWGYFLRGSAYFNLEHTADWDYTTAAFRASYPVSSSDYSGSTAWWEKGWVSENGERYYYRNAKPVRGLWNIGGETYYFSMADNRMMTGLVNTGKGIRLFAQDGRMLKGLQGYGGVTYYFSAKDGVRLTGLVTTDDSGTKRYFSAKTGEMLTGLVNTDGKGALRYFDKADGHMLTGIVAMEGGRRYFSAKDGRMMRGGWVTGESGVKYLLDANGWVKEESF